MTQHRPTSSAAPLLAANPHDEGRGWHAGRLELLAVVHVAVLLVFTSWDFGGETDFARVAICWWGTLAVPIAGLVCLRRWERRDGMPAALRWLWPMVVFDCLVLLSTLNPSFSYAMIGGVRTLVNTGARSRGPSCALPVASLQDLWQFNAIYLSCFNLTIAVVRRRVLRALLMIFTANALALAVMGTFQKLANATGLYFGLQPSPNSEFFATFIYHNHWGAYVTLGTAAALGLLFHHARHGVRSGERHSPVLFGLVATLFLAAAVPLSTSRSGALLVSALITAALVQWLRHVSRMRRAAGRATGPPLVLAAAVVALGLGGIYLLGRPLIDQRAATTRRQLEAIRLRGDLGNRTQLYADTWRMAREKPWFGWGLGTYAEVFPIFNQQLSVEGWVPFYREAHSDWLQALAEVGLTGTVLLGLIAALPLVAAFRLGPPGVLPAYLLAGCGLLVLYALVEFPFANPAVLEAFWCCLFTAVRYHKLTVANV